MIKDEIVAKLVALVAEDIVARPVTSRDGIWRFDNVIRDGLADSCSVGLLTRDDYAQMAKIARASDGGWVHWAPAMIVASFMETKAAFMTPGFLEARRARLYGN
jgi:hypothetical protein